MLLFFIFNIFSVYFTSQILQMSTLINQKDHNHISSFNLVYDALYTVLVVLGIHQIHGITQKQLTIKQSVLYTVTCHIGAVVFGLAGEIPFLRRFTLTKGFWKRLNLEGKIVIGLITVFVIMLICIQLYRLIKRKNYKVIIPFVVLVVIWGMMWVILFNEKISFHVHVHHALFAGLIACIFDTISTFDIVINAFLIGIVIEGIDFYGIGELSLFMFSTQDTVDTAGIYISWALCIIALITCILTKSYSKKLNPFDYNEL